MPNTVDTTERLLTPAIPYDQNIGSTEAMAAVLDFNQYFRQFGCAWNYFEDYNAGNYGEYVWKDNPDQEYEVASQYYTFELFGLYTYSYGGNSYSYLSYHEGPSVWYFPPTDENGTNSQYSIFAGLEFPNPMHVTKIVFQMTAWKTTAGGYQENGEWGEFETYQIGNVSGGLWQGYFLYKWNYYDYEESTWLEVGFPLAYRYDQYDTGYLDSWYQENPDYEYYTYGTPLKRELQNRDDLFEDEYGNFWYKKAKFRYSQDKFTVGTSYETVEANVSMRFVDQSEYDPNHLITGSDIIVEIIFTFDEPVEAQSIWISPLDHEPQGYLRNDYYGAYYQTISSNYIDYWGVYGYGEFTKPPQWDDLPTYKPQILIGHEEPHYEVQGEPYWLIRYAGDEFSYSATPVFDASGKPIGKQNKTGLKPHLQWVLKFPNRLCKGYPEDLFMIDEVWSIVSGTIMRKFGSDITYTSQRWLFAEKQDAFDCFPPNPTTPFAVPKLHLRITCMALRHLDYCMTVENGLGTYRTIDYYRQIHWEEHSPLIDPTEKPHEAVNVNIRYWFGAIKKVEEMFFGDFKGAGYPDLLLWERPPESFSEDVKCYSSDGWEYQCNPYFNIPQHLWSRTIMPNRHGYWSGQPKAIATDWKSKYQSINPCAVYVPNEGEGDENCYSN